jgi:hypothetical protein
VFIIELPWGYVSFLDETLAAGLQMELTIKNQIWPEDLANFA